MLFKQPGYGKSKTKHFVTSVSHVIEYRCFFDVMSNTFSNCSNFGKLNYYLGARAAEEGRDSRYPDINFCEQPDAICASGEWSRKCI